MLITSGKPQVMVLVVVLSLATTVFAQQPEKTVANYVTAGIAAQRSGKHEEALQQYEAAIKLDPKDFGAQFNSGVSYMHFAQVGRSLECVQGCSSPETQ